MTKIGQLYRESVANNIREGVEKRGNVFLLTYTKVSSMQMDTLRKTLRRAGARMYVSKNTVARRTLKELQFEPLADKVNGQVAFIWSDADSAEVSKTLTKFTKEFQGVLIQGGVLQGKVLDTADVKRLADLPAREVLLGQFLGTLQSPVVRIMGALNGKTKEFLSIFKQFSEKK